MSQEAARDGAAGIAGTAGPAGVSGGPDRGWVVALVCWVLPAALLVTVVAVPAAWTRVPASVGEAGVIIAALGAGLVWRGWDLARKRTPPGRADPSGWNRPAPGKAVRVISVGLLVMAFSAAAVIWGAVANHSGADGAGGEAGVIAGPVLLAAFTGYVLRRYGGLGVADDGSPRSSLGLRAGERAVWTGRAHSRWPFSTWLLVALAGSVCFPGALHWDLTDALPLVVLITIGLLGFTSVRVTVAARGVTVGYGVLGLRLTRIPLRAIAWAEATEQGKFGFTFPFTGSLLLQGQASVVLRSGPALRLTLRDGKTFLVTVDDAATGAALLNDLIAGLPDHGLPDHGASGS
jgi:hypothetical protein